MTTVRDLLDIAAAELGSTSVQITSGRAPGPSAAADGWTVLLPAAQHLTLQTVGPWSKVHASPVRQLAAVQAPDPGRVATPISSVRRAADAMGAAGDLLSTRVRTGSLTERRALLHEAVRLLAASAEVTLHGVGHDLSHSDTITSAARVGELSYRFGVLDRLPASGAGPLSHTAAPSPVLPLAHHGGPLAHAVHVWSGLALRLPDEPAISSQDLRGTAVVAAHLLGFVQRAQAAGPPDATAVPTTSLQRWIRQWQRAEHLMRTIVLAGPVHQPLARASWDVVARARELAPGDDGRATLSPYASSVLCRAVVDATTAVADAHARAVNKAALDDHLVVHIDRLAWSLQHPGAPAHTTWMPATAEHVRPLVSIYARLMTTRGPRETAVGRPRTSNTAPTELAQAGLTKVRGPAAAPAPRRGR